MVEKIEEKIEKTRHGKDNDKSMKYILEGQRNVRYYDRILPNRQKCENYHKLIN